MKMITFFYNRYNPDRGSKMNAFKFLAWPGSLRPTLLLIMLTFFLVSCGNTKEQEKADAEPQSSNLQKVEVVKPARRSFAAEVLITGRAKPFQKVTLYAMESGFMKDMRVDIGDQVQRGEVLAVLDNPELYRLKSQREAEYKAKKSVYERLRSVRAKTPSLTPVAKVEEAEANYLSAKAKFEAVQDRIAFLRIKAPFSGVITRRLVCNGALLQSGLKETDPQAIAELQQTNPIRLTIPLPEGNAAALQKGTEVTISLPELPGKNFKATVSRTAKALDPASKTMQVEIDVANPEGRILTGMYAKVRLTLSSRDSVLSLPHIAKMMHRDKPHILIVKSGMVKRIPLRIGLNGKDHFEVLNPEITAQTQVIVQGKSLVEPGQKVDAVLKQ